jgi:hypothetical protein
MYRACIRPYNRAADRDSSSVSASVGAGNNSRVIEHCEAFIAMLFNAINHACSIPISSDNQNSLARAQSVIVFFKRSHRFRYLIYPK